VICYKKIGAPREKSSLYFGESCYRRDRDRGSSRSWNAPTLFALTSVTYAIKSVVMRPHSLSSSERDLSETLALN